jgi:hypothetical protein
MDQGRLRYLTGAAAGACLTGIVVWVVDQLRRDSIRSGDEPTGAPAARRDGPPPVGDA